MSIGTCCHPLGFTDLVMTNRQSGISNLKSIGLPWLDAEDEVADGDLLIGHDFCALFAWELASCHQGGIAALRHEPVTAIVEREHRMYTTNFRITSQWQVNCNGSRTASDSDLLFSDRHHRFAYTVLPNLN